MSTTITIASAQGTNTVITPVVQNTTVSIAGNIGPPGQPGAFDPDVPVAYIIFSSVPSGTLYKWYLNDDGSPQVDPYTP